MGSLPRRAPVAMLASLLLIVTGVPAHGQESGMPQPERAWAFAVSATPVYQGSADMDGGGSYRTVGVLLRLGMSGPIVERLRGGLVFSYDHRDAHFTTPRVFGGVAPWEAVQRIGIAAPLSLGLADGWRVGVTPSLDSFREDAASWGSSLIYGGTVAVTKTLSGGARFGLGGGIFGGLNKLTGFPLIVVDLPITARLRLTNPLTAGPTGPAGLELSYRLDGGWSLGVAGAYRSYRFRLNEAGPFANGVGEERGAPLVLHLAKRFDPHITVDLYAGAVVGGWMRVEDSGGNKIAAADFDPAPIVALTLSGTF
ncbi:MAG: hypothetical protein EHM71_08560 [Zetaproteobacteria bacterium]|nr:MAG: hypothetical protein EHM71_08560 [Zetaproteobacteria bacterium]